MLSDTDSISVHSRPAKNKKYLTFKPGDFRNFNFASEANASEDSADGDSGDNEDSKLVKGAKTSYGEHGKNEANEVSEKEVKSEPESAAESSSIVSEKFKTIRIGHKAEASEILRPRSNSSRSVLRLPKKPQGMFEFPKAQEGTFELPKPHDGALEFVPKTKPEISFVTPTMKPKTIAYNEEMACSTLDVHAKHVAVQDSQQKEECLLDNGTGDTAERPSVSKSHFKWISTAWIGGVFHRSSSSPEKKRKKVKNTESYMISFWVIWVWSVWTLVCMASMLCFIPWLDEASLWFPHFRLYLEKSSHVTWIDFFDEFLKVISYFATDLRGFSRKDYDPNIEFISNSAYSFDYSSWCRDIPMTASTTCYSGRGMDVISGIVTDLGVQIGVAGRMENPIQFGANFAATFRSTVHDIDKIYKEIVESAYLSAETSTLDISKLELVHKAALSIKLGNFVWPLKVAHASCMVVFSASLMFLLSTKRKPSVWVKVGTASFLVLCEAITFSTYTLETIYLSELNNAAHSYDVTLTSGLGSTLMIVEFLLGIFLGVLYTVN